MKSPIRLPVLTICALLAMGITGAQAALLFSADAKTVTVAGTGISDSPIATRLYLDNGFSLAAPLGTTIWFVADVNHNGVPAEGAGSSQVTLSQILGGDDVVLYRGMVDGDQAGSTAGRYRQTGIEVNGDLADLTAFQNANIYAYLWNASGADYTPVEGVTFGIQNLGINPPPTLGNAFWAIDQNMSASQFSVNAVPEPAISGAIAAGFLAVVVAAQSFLRRRSRNARAGN